MPDNSAEIARLKALLNSGVTTVTIDGQATAFDVAAARKRLRELQATDDDATAATKRPVASNIYLGGF